MAAGDLFGFAADDFRPLVFTVCGDPGAKGRAEVDRRRGHEDIRTPLFAIRKPWYHMPMLRLALLLACLCLTGCDTSQITKPLPPYNAANNAVNGQ